MEKTIYNSRSNPGKKEIIPSEYYCKAEKIVQFSLKSKNMSEFYNQIEKEPSLNEIYIPDATVCLVHNKKGSLKLQDEVFLTACLHMSNDALSHNGVIYGEFPVQESGAERLELIRGNQNIKRALESLD